MDQSRRGFLTYLGMGSYALMRNPVAAADFPVQRRRENPFKFKPIAASMADEVVLPEDFDYQVVSVWGDKLGSTGPNGPEAFGFNNDLTVYFPIDGLEGGTNSKEGLLWVNHEYTDPLFVSNYQGRPPKKKEQILAEKLSVGGSVLHLRHQDGKWQLVPDSKYTRRFTALYPQIALTGPAAQAVPEGTGTLGNCSGGRTPWMTVLSCEENFQWYNAKVDGGFRWSDQLDHEIDEQEYGWVVEVDPFDKLKPMKHSCLGRFKHENTALRYGAGKKGQLVVYMGDDDLDQCFYKYVSHQPYRADAAREEQRALLTAGTLYAADFAKGRWLPLDITHPTSRRRLKSAGFTSQAQVLLRAPDAARALGATPIDRPEDCEVHPLDGSVYIALSNNARHGNLHGQLVRLVEDGDDPASESFQYEIFLVGGAQSGLSCPDNLAFDKKGNLWVVCDMSGEKIGKGAYKPFGNNGLYVVPTAGPGVGDAFQFASGPRDAELTGPWFTPDEQTLFLSVQHPGDECKSKEEKDLTSGWPHPKKWPARRDALPRPAVIAVTGKFPVS